MANPKSSLNRPVRQVDKMRQLGRDWGENNDSAIIKGYAEAEKSGEIIRKSNASSLTPEEYGRRLLYDCRRKHRF